MREKEGLTNYPDEDKIDDLRHLVPSDYIFLFETHPVNGDIESLVERIEAHFKEQDSKRKTRKPGSRNRDYKGPERPSATLIQDHSGGRGGRGGRNGGRNGGRGRGGGRGGAGGRGGKPLGPCYLCQGPHLARDCPHMQAAQQAVRSTAMTRVQTEDAQQAAATDSTAQQPQQGTQQTALRLAQAHQHKQMLLRGTLRCHATTATTWWTSTTASSAV